MANLRTPLYNWHVERKARMVPFGGWDMPVQYAGIKAEHTAVRECCGLFDISHMGRLVFEGPDAGAFLHHVWTNDALGMKPGQVRYGLLCNDAGGILDDVLVYRFDHLDPPFWTMVVNASNRPKVVDWLSTRKLARDVTVTDRTDDWAMIALQGPRAVETNATAAKLKYYFAAVEPYPDDEGVQIVSRTGYTGEDGYELIVPAGKAEEVVFWLTEKQVDYRFGFPVTPCGLGARDTLRLEAAMPLYGHEMDEKTDPLQAGLGWAVKLNKDEFVGRASLARLQADDSRPVRVGLELAGRRIAREGSPVVFGSAVVGRVTSGTLSPTLDRSVAMAYVPPTLASAGTRVEVDVRGTAEPATVVPLPFYKRPRV